MPKLSLPGIIVASIAFFLVGFVWYGLAFQEAWMAAEGVSAADAEGGSPVWMALGFFITVLQVIGLALVLRWKGVSSMADAATTAAILWALFALPLTLYDFAYLPAHNVTLLIIDASHLLVGWIVAAVALSFFKVK
jgi:hypothetical protein